MWTIERLKILIFGTRDGQEKPETDDLIFGEIRHANAALKKYKGSRMKTFDTFEKALDFLTYPDKDESFLDASFLDALEDSTQDLAASLEKLSIGPAGEQAPEFPSVKPAQLSALRRLIEADKYDEVEETIWENPRHLVTVSDSASYLMAGFKYNACHIAARANKPDIMAMILDTVSNTSFMKKLYPTEPDLNLKERVNHLLDSYLNTPDSRQGNTPLHYACKLGYYRVVRVLLTFEGCDQKLKDSEGKTAEEMICCQMKGEPELVEQTKKKIKSMFKSELHLPRNRDQLKKRLLLQRRRSKVGRNYDSDTSFSDDSFMISPAKSLK